MKIDFSNVMQSLADMYGDREAMVNVERNRRLTFSEYHALTNRVANMLNDGLGLGRDDRYFCVLENDNLSLMTFPSIFKAKACCTYTNIRDPLEEHLRQIDHVEPSVVFIETAMLEEYYAPLHERGITVVAMDGVGDDFEASEQLHAFWALTDAASDANPHIVHDDRDDCLLMRFTGGTTGLGKCAMYSIDNWLMCRDSFLSIPDGSIVYGDHFLHVAPISHGSGMMLLPTMFLGGCNFTLNNPDLDIWCRTVETEQITAAFQVPTLMYRLLELASAQDADLGSLTTFYYGAAPMSPAKLKQLQERFGNIFIQVYGSTENICASAAMPRFDHVVESEEEEAHLAAAGKPVPGTELIICDDDGNAVPTGEIGEIWMRSRAICKGYFRNPDQSAAEFEDGYWKSGDLARQDKNGFVYVVDRKKDMIITGGFNVYVNEVEAALNAHPSVLMSAVVGIPSSDWGEAVHAEVMLREGFALDEDAIKQFVKRQIGGVKAPKSIIATDELPLSSAGKVLRREVRSKYWTDADRRVA